VEVTSADIARIAGVGANAVSNWRKRHEDFPKPIGGTDRSPRFALAEVQAWLSRQGKAVEVTAEQKLWQALDSTQSTMSPVDALGLVGTLLLYLRAHPATSVPQDSREFDQLVGHAEHFWVTHAANASGMLEATGPTGIAVGELGARQATLFQAAAEACAVAGADKTFADLCDRVLDAGPRAGLAPTAPELAELMLDLAGPAEGELLDPACGTGSILLAAEARGYRRVLGQELSAPTARIALLRLAFAADASGNGSYGVQVGDSFSRDAFPGFEAAAVVSNPPFADRTWWHDELANDSRWVYGVPARLDSELAWVQHALAHVVPGGRVVLLMPPGAAARASGRRIRAEFVQRGVLRAVVALPPRAAASYALSLQVWVLQQPGNDRRVPRRVLMIDTASPETVSGRAALRRESPDWEQLREELATAWSAFERAPEQFTEWSGVARSVPVAELLDDEVDLTPRRHLPLAVSDEAGHDSREALRTSLSERIAALARLLPGELPEAGAGSEHVRVMSVDELARVGGVFMRRPVPVLGEPDEPLDADTIEARAVTARDVVLGQAPSETMTVLADAVRNPPIRDGDVLVPAFGRRLVARVASGDDIGAYASAGVFVLRPDLHLVDPWYLACFFSSSEGGRQATRSASSLRDNFRFDPRKIRVPLLPLESQRVYGAAFRRLTEFSLELRTVHDLGRELVGLATDALLAELSVESRSRVL
jgi:SAM-dependent methyltransferase